MSNGFQIKALDEKDMAYALVSWRESHHQAPQVKRMPWEFYKERYGKVFERLIADGLCLGAYSFDELLGFLVATPGKRVHTLHWVQVKFKDKQGEQIRRRGIMTELLNAADLGTRFAYTLRARKLNGETLDETIAKKLLERDVVATYIPLLDWIK